MSIAAVCATPPRRRLRVTRCCVARNGDTGGVGRPGVAAQRRPRRAAAGAAAAAATPACRIAVDIAARRPAHAQAKARRCWLGMRSILVSLNQALNKNVPIENAGSIFPSQTMADQGAAGGAADAAAAEPVRSDATGAASSSGAGGAEAKQPVVALVRPALCAPRAAGAALVAARAPSALRTLHAQL
jgi:hypothetical protein